jgi:hypothetical protein
MRADLRNGNLNGIEFNPHVRFPFVAISARSLAWHEA